MYILALVLALAEPVTQVEELYYQGRYEEVIRVAGEIIDSDSLLEPGEEIGLRKFIAFSYVVLNKKDHAKAEFKTILSYDATTRLDPKLVSPKIIEVFEEARQEFERSSTAPTINGLQPVNNILPIDEELSLRGAMVRSFAYPGWGQHYAKERTKGWIFITAEGLSLCGLVVSQIFTQYAHQDYLDATEPLQIEERYRIYNNWYRVRNAFGGLAVGIWICAPFELAVFPPSWAADR
ncbi:hypothetical protein JXM67_14390 [candidate division WOR-3 bacterium]|nr:hypothetical protein [candidate division WOR-3 bacterium]